MPYLSTSTRTLGRPRVWLAMLAAFVACSGGSNAISGPGNSSGGSDAAILAAVASVTVTPSPAGTLGGSTQYVAVAKNANGSVLPSQTFLWTSSDSTIVEVSSTGVGSNVGVGTATITASTPNGIAGTTSQFVGGGAAIATILVTPNQVSLGAGQTTRFAVTLKDAAGNILTGRRVLWQSSDPQIMRVDSTGVGTPIGQGSVTINVVSGGVAAAASADVSGTPVQLPGAVGDLAVLSTTDTSATVRFTQVGDGDGAPATYDVHVSVPPIDFASAPSVARGTCATPLVGTAISGTASCTVFGLSPSTTYNIQLVAYRGTLNLNAVVGGLSNVAVGTTAPSRVVASIIVTPSAPTISVGQQLPLTATVSNANGVAISGAIVTWTTSNPAVATVGPTGVVTTLAAGDVIITASSAGFSGQSHVTVGGSAPGIVGNLTVAAVTDTSATLAFTQVGDGLGGPASYDIRVSSPPISFGSATPVARGTCSSPVTGTLAGSPLVCTVFGLSATTSYNFQLVAYRGTLGTDAVSGQPSNVALGTTAVVPVTSVTVNPGVATANVGPGGAQFTAITRDKNGNILTGRPVVWTSSNPAVAAISSTGLATGTTLGVTTITATSGVGSGTATLTTTAPPGAVPAAVSNLSVSAFTDTSATLSFTQVSNGVGGAANYDIRYSVGPITFASAQSVTSGTCTTPLAGTTVGSPKSCKVYGLTPNTAYQFQVIGFTGVLNVNAVFGGLSNIVGGTTTLTPVASITVTPTTATTNVGSGGVQYTATLRSSGGNILSGPAYPVTWNSSNNAVATVTASGLASGVANGTASIRATSGAATSAPATLTVSTQAPGSVADLAVSAPTDTSVTLTFTQVGDGLNNPASYDIRFAPSPITFASATSVTRGTCNTPLAGTAIGSPLSCTVFGLSASTAYQFQVIAFRGTLNVNAVFGGLSNVASGSTTLATVASATVTPPTATTNVGSGGVTYTAVLKDGLGNVLSGPAYSGTVTWGSSNAAIATVSAAGGATGVAAGGPVTITATSGTHSGTAQLTVTTPVTPPGSVNNLTATTANDTSVTLNFTQVADGLGGAASYDVRFMPTPISWGSATSTASGTCTTPVAGTTAGSPLSCTVRGLTPNTAYQFQVIAFRGTLNMNAVFGTLSNIVSKTTTLTPVATVTVSPASPTTNVGSGGVQFAAVLKDAGGNVLSGPAYPITWGSSNNAIATVSAAGLATGVAGGSATITATSGAASGNGALTVNLLTPAAVTNLALASVNDSIATLTFTQVSDGLGGAANYDMRFAPLPLTWGAAPSVTSGTCATTIAGTSVGAVITCTAKGLTPGTAYQFQLISFRGTINVNAVFGPLSNLQNVTTTLTPVASVTVSPTAPTTNVGGSVQFTAVLKDAGGHVLTGRPVTWSSGTPAVGTVNATGLASGVSGGTTIVTATSGAASGPSTLTVTAAPPNAPGTVNDLSVTATSDTSVTLHFTQVTNGAGSAASYVVGFGLPPITQATATNAARGTCATPVAGTTVGNPISCTVFGLNANTAYQFEAVAFRGTLNVNAVYGPVSNIASSTTARTAVATVTVVPTAGDIGVGATLGYTAVAKDSHGNAITGWPVTWSSANLGIATVDGQGMITGVTAGTTSITATINGVSGAAPAVIEALPPPPVGGGGGAYPNQPAGYARIAETNFAALPGPSMIGGKATLLASPASLETIASAGSLPLAFPVGTGTAFKHIIESGTPSGYSESGSHYAQFQMWNLGGVASSHGGPADVEYSAFYQSTYFSIYGNGTTIETPPPGMKALGYWGVTNNNQNASGIGPTQIYAFFVPVSPNPTTPLTASQFTINMATQNGSNILFQQNLNTSKHVVVGQVHRFEQVLTLGTAGVANGTWDWWLDGTQIGHYTNVPYINSGYASSGGNGLSGFWGWQFSPIWGGSGGAAKTRSDVIYLGYTYISGIFLRNPQ